MGAGSLSSLEPGRLRLEAPGTQEPDDDDVHCDGPCPPYKISVKEGISQAIIAAATEVYGELPVVNGVSAEGAILRHVWIPCVLTGFANPGANLHAPDENIQLDTYLLGIKYAAAIMEHFSKT